MTEGATTQTDSHFQLVACGIFCNSPPLPYLAIYLSSARVHLVHLLAYQLLGWLNFIQVHSTGP